MTRAPISVHESTRTDPSTRRVAERTMYTSENHAFEHELSRTAHHLSMTDRSNASSSWPTSCLREPSADRSRRRRRRHHHRRRGWLCCHNALPSRHGQVDDVDDRTSRCRRCRHVDARVPCAVQYSANIGRKQPRNQRCTDKTSSTGVRSVLPRWPSTMRQWERRYVCTTGWGRLRVGRMVLTRRRMKPREGNARDHEEKERMRQRLLRRVRQHPANCTSLNEPTMTPTFTSPASEPPRGTHRFPLFLPSLPDPPTWSWCYFIHKRVSQSTACLFNNIFLSRDVQRYATRYILISLRK